MVEWIGIYITDIIFWAWIVFWGGAEWLEGTFASGFVVFFWAPRWSSEGIKLYTWGQFILHTIWFLIGLFSPSARFFA